MRVVLIARHYPPAVSGGAKRPWLLAKAMREQGVDVRVCAPSLPDGEPGWAVPHPNRDPPVAGKPGKPNLRGLARELLLWPDPDIRWCLRAADVVLSDGWRPDWALSTSPPESIHVAGHRIAQRTGARWAADFRDLWLTNPHRRERLSPHRQFGERLLARRLLPKADLILAVDPVVAKEMETLGANSPIVLPHFTTDTPPVPAELSPDNLHVVHAGSIALSDPQADIGQLLRAFEAAYARNPALQLQMVGRLTDIELASIKASTANQAIKIHGALSFEDALKIMAGSDALAFVASAKMHVPPSKITDYLMMDRPIVACGDGPWRKDPRVSSADPIEEMAHLKRGDKRNVQYAPPTATEMASLLIARMKAIQSR